jgi:nucleotide-binding universal stress UspA family protein
VPAAFVAEARKAAQAKLDAALEKAREKGVAGTATLGEVPAAPAVASRAEEIEADLVAIGTRGHTGIKHILLGSVAERTVHDAPCSVLTVKGEGDAAFPPKAIAVGVDFSDPGAAALEAARELATEFGAKLHLIHALDLRIPFVTPYEVSVPDAFIESAREAAQEKLDALCQEVRQKGVEVESHLASAAPASALSEAARQIGVDLIVTGSRGLTGLKHVVLGSVAERTLRHAPCSVLTVKPPSEA